MIWLLFIFVGILTLLVAAYLVGWREERQSRARIKRRLREIQNDPAQWGGA